MAAELQRRDPSDGLADQIEGPEPGGSLVACMIEPAVDEAMMPTAATRTSEANRPAVPSPEPPHIASPCRTAAGTEAATGLSDTGCLCPPWSEQYLCTSPCRQAGLRGEGRVIKKVFDEDSAAQLLPFDSDAADCFAIIVSARRRADRPIRQFDASVAAVERSRAEGLATCNGKDFVDCGLCVIDPRMA